MEQVKSFVQDNVPVLNKRQKQQRRKWYVIAGVLIGLVVLSAAGMLTIRAMRNNNDETESAPAA
jgi:hypothetical protein